MKKTIVTLSLLAGGLTANAGTFSVEASALYVMPDVDSSYTGQVFENSPAVQNFNGSLDFLADLPGPLLDGITALKLSDDEDFDDSVGFSVKLNYDLDNSGFSFGTEFLYFGTESDFDYRPGAGAFAGTFLEGSPIANAVGASGFSTNEQFDVYGGMVNVFYDFEFKKLSLKVGAGIGYAYIENELDVSGSLLPNGPLGGSASYSDDDGVLAYQFIIGGEYDFTESLSVFLTYRYIGFEDPSFSYGNSEGPLSAPLPDYDAEISAQAIELGISFDF